MPAQVLPCDQRCKSANPKPPPFPSSTDYRSPVCAHTLRATMSPCHAMAASPQLTTDAGASALYIARALSTRTNPDLRLHRRVSGCARLQLRKWGERRRLRITAANSAPPRIVHPNQRPRADPRAATSASLRPLPRVRCCIAGRAVRVCTSVQHSAADKRGRRDNQPKRLCWAHSDGRRRTCVGRLAVGAERGDKPLYMRRGWLQRGPAPH